MMYITDIVTQIKNIMPAVGLGFVLGIVYLFVRICRAFLSDGRVVIFITDVLFCLVCTLTSFLLFVAVNNGHIRFYLIIAEILGFCTFSFTFGELLFNYFQRMIAVLHRIVRPLSAPLRAGVKKISEKFIIFKNKLKKLLQQRRQMLYNIKD